LYIVTVIYYIKNHGMSGTFWTQRKWEQHSKLLSQNLKRGDNLGELSVDGRMDLKETGFRLDSCGLG